MLVLADSLPCLTARSAQPGSLALVSRTCV